MENKYFNETMETQSLFIEFLHLIFWIYSGFQEEKEVLFIFGLMETYLYFRYYLTANMFFMELRNKPSNPKPYSVEQEPFIPSRICLFPTNRQFL